MEKEAEKLDFGALSGRGVKVAIVDSGVDALHPGVGGLENGVDLAPGPRGKTLRTMALTDRVGHGTACAGLVRKSAPEVELYSVRIFDETLEAEGGLLVAAIEWALESGMDVVNLSLGTTNPAWRQALNAVCDKATAAGLILVAAAHNEGRESYPAALPQVIGVEGAQIHRARGYYYRKGATIECAARGDRQRLCWRRGGEAFMGGSSFAAPHLSAVVARIRQAFPGAGVEEVRRVLEVHALEERLPVERRPRDLLPPAGGREKPYAWIQKAVLYPFTKEMHAFLRFGDLLDFEVAAVADPVGRGLAGRDAGEVAGRGECGVRIETRLEGICARGDTLVLGYVDRLGRIQRRDLLRECVEKALECGVHVFSFSSLPRRRYEALYARARRRGLRLEYPHIGAAEVERALSQAAPGAGVEVPVLGVFGTSSAQGKFTLQLGLRRALLREGYRLGQLGTEPHAELFGLDLGFPMGYDSPLELPLQYYAPYLDAKMHQICRGRKVDLVLVGSQSGTIPYDMGDMATFSLPSLAFLLGTRPDACILVVNSIDPDAYVQDTLDTLRIVGKAPAIALAMSDQEKSVRGAWGRQWQGRRRMEEEEIEEKLHHLEERFGLPAACIGREAGVEKILRAVIRYFASGESTHSEELSWHRARA